MSYKDAQETLHLNLIYAIQVAEKEKIPRKIIISELWSALFAFSSTYIGIDVEEHRID